MSLRRTIWRRLPGAMPMPGGKRRHVATCFLRHGRTAGARVPEDASPLPSRG